MTEIPYPEGTRVVYVGPVVERIGLIGTAQARSIVPRPGDRFRSQTTGEARPPHPDEIGRLFQRVQWDNGLTTEVQVRYLLPLEGGDPVRVENLEEQVA
jgi:hypothetical protein